MSALLVLSCHSSVCSLVRLRIASYLRPRRLIPPSELTPFDWTTTHNITCDHSPNTLQDKIIPQLVFNSLKNPGNHHGGIILADVGFARCAPATARGIRDIQGARGQWWSDVSFQYLPSICRSSSTLRHFFLSLPLLLIGASFLPSLARCWTRRAQYWPAYSSSAQSPSQFPWSTTNLAYYFGTSHSLQSSFGVDCFSGIVD